MAPLFDAYVMLDWSAEARPKTGADSIWWCCLERREGRVVAERIANPPTRHQAVAGIAALLGELIARDRTTLLGVDFALGFPAGFAGRLDAGNPGWLGTWREIAARIEDGEDNANNRFAVAAELNRRVSGHGFPFWGCPAKAETPFLPGRRPAEYGPKTLAERRLADRAAKGVQPVWKLAYPGSVGSQTLLGIPRLLALRNCQRLAGLTRVWPFETGLAPLGRSGKEGWQVLFAEVYPSMLGIDVPPGEIKDRAQVRALARYFAALDRRGQLAPLFAGPAGLDDRGRRRVETEEGWILGAGTPAERPAAASRYHYLRQPEEIYRRSFAIIRGEADLSALPPEMHQPAVRLIHASGMTDIVADLAFSCAAAAAGRRALAAGAPILVDTEMLAHGIIRGRLPAANPVICTLAGAAADGTTRSAAAVDRWGSRLDGAVVAIGNAPTALFRLLELLDQGAPRPALILAFPVGFVGAAESKQALIEHPGGVPYLTLRGRRGGSALAAAAVNALAGEGL